MVLCGNTALYLYIGRVFAGATGGGMYICLPLFVAEIADQRLVERKISHFKRHIHLVGFLVVGVSPKIPRIYCDKFTFHPYGAHPHTNISHAIRLSCRHHAILIDNIHFIGLTMINAFILHH